MGFLRFMKKDKLDLPPAPPIGDLPSLEREFPSLPEMPSIPSFSSEELPEPPRMSLPNRLPNPEPVVEEPEMPKPKIEKPLSPKKESNFSPIYMEVDKYRDILEEMSSIKDSIKAADNALQKLYELKDNRDKEIGRWHARMEDIQRKLNFLDKSLFEGK